MVTKFDDVTAHFDGYSPSHFAEKSNFENKSHFDFVSKSQIEDLKPKVNLRRIFAFDFQHQMEVIFDID